MIKIEKVLETAIGKALSDLDISYEGDILLEHPNDLSHGDYSTNIGMSIFSAHEKIKKQIAQEAYTDIEVKRENIIDGYLTKGRWKSPRELAEALVQSLVSQGIAELKEVSLAGPGFINFTLVDTYFSDQLGTILEQKDAYGHNQLLSGEKVITEFTDPNPFKLFHIGHVMSNTIGESLSRIFSASGAEVKWSNYQGDVGMHVAKALWGIIDLGGIDQIKDYKLEEQVAFLGKAYAHGATAYKEEHSVSQMQAINKSVYERSDETLNDLYDWGRKISLEYFEYQYRRLGTFHNKEENKAFNYYFFESQVGGLGKEKVLEGVETGVFQESDGAIIFPGDKYGLHKRVFVNALGLPTYEAKELGLSKTKYDLYPYTQSFIITANEINEYFKVLLKAMSFVFPALAEKTTHIGHGMMKFTGGKMSSRTGDVITADQLFADISEMVIKKAEGREMSEDLVSDIAVAAVKFAILRQDTSKDIVFDPEQSISFEGDSGPYLQYTHARCSSVLRKASGLDISISTQQPEDWEVIDLERYLYRFQGVVSLALEMRAPHRIANYLIETAQMFNTWYSSTKIVDAEDSTSSYKLALTQATAQVIHNALWLLGIKAPHEM